MYAPHTASLINRHGENYCLTILLGVLGSSRELVEINITRRKNVDGNADRLNLVDELDNLRVWAKQNPPDNCHVILADIAKPKNKSASGTEDFVLTLRLEEA